MIAFNCFTCDAPNAKLRCSRCKLAHYCGAECQRKDWAGHKQHCVPHDLFDVLKNAHSTMNQQYMNENLREIPQDLKSVPVEESDKFKDESCGICLDPLNNPVMLDCNHYFCKGCLEQYRSHTMDASCPYCRSKLPPDSKSVLLHNAVILVQRANRKESSSSDLDPIRIMQLPKPPADIEEDVPKPIAAMPSTNDEMLESDFATARQHLDQLLMKDPHNVCGKILYASVLAKDNTMESIEKVMDLYQSCIDRTSDVNNPLTAEKINVNVTCLLKISDLCIKMERFNKALACAKEAVSFLPSNSVRIRHCLFNLCASSIGIGEYQNAIEYGNMALQMNPYYPGQYYLIAQAQFLEGHPYAAVITMQKAVAMEAPWDKEHGNLVKKQLQEFIWLQNNLDAAVQKQASLIRIIPISTSNALESTDVLLFTSQLHDKTFLEEIKLKVECAYTEETSANKDNPPDGAKFVDLASEPIASDSGSMFHYQNSGSTNRATLQYGYDFFRLEQGDFTFTDIPPYLQELGNIVYDRFISLSDGKVTELNNDCKKCCSVGGFNNIIISFYEEGYKLEPHIDTDIESMENRPKYYFDEDVYGVILQADEEGRLYFSCDEATEGIGHLDGSNDISTPQDNYEGSSLSAPKMLRPLQYLDEASGVVFKLTGPIRHGPYYHGVSTVKSRRVSITFRTVIFPASVDP